MPLVTERSMEVANKRGDLARQAVYDKIAEAFGEDTIGLVDKKLYVQTKEGNEMIQFAITITMPKNPIAGTEVVSPDAPAWETPQAKPRVELSEEDRKQVDYLMEKLGF